MALVIDDTCVGSTCPSHIGEDLSGLSITIYGIVELPLLEHISNEMMA